MGKIINAALVSVIAAGFLLTAALPASACSCIAIDIEDAIREDTAAAFVGTAIASKELGYPEGPGDTWHEPVRWTFVVELVLRGEVTEVVNVGSGYGSGDCGVDFSNMGRVGVVAYEDDLGLATGICGGVWDADALIEAYGAGEPPIPGGDLASTGVPVWVWAVAGGVLIFTVAGVDVANRRAGTQN